MKKKEKESQLQKIHDELRAMRLPMVRDFEESDFNSYILVGFLPDAHIKLMIGRIVQIRMESGEFGSNQIFLRQYDENLQVHENQWFYKIPAEFTDRLNDIFKDSVLDKPNTTYSIKDQEHETGFVIKSKIKAGETTPLREMRTAIRNKISEIITKDE